MEDMLFSLLASVDIDTGGTYMMTVRRDGVFGLNKSPVTTALQGSIFPLYCFMIAIAIFSMRGSICRNDFAPWRKQPDRLLASTEKRRSETSCLVAKAIFGRVPGQSTVVSRLMPPKSRAHVFFDISEIAPISGDVHLIGGFNFVSRVCQFVFDKARNTTISGKLQPRPVLSGDAEPFI